jgi:hypothetical protein
MIKASRPSDSEAKKTIAQTQPVLNVKQAKSAAKKVPAKKAVSAVRTIVQEKI